MTVTGIIAEFNPFHNGHKYLLNQAQGTKIVAMSGNFVQRGEPALVDKWVRTQMALNNGADLVVELPFLVAVQSADYFAQGAIDILQQLGVDTLTFGTEELLDYQKIANSYEANKDKIEAFLKTLPDSLTYPQKTQKMWETFAGIAFSGNTPNHILGLAYAKACAGKNIQLHPIMRQGAGYHSQDKDVAYASATSLRLHREDEAFLEKFIPNVEWLWHSPKVTWENYFLLLKYHIITNPDLTRIFQVNQEIASRLQTAIRQVSTVDELVASVATKRYTKARVRRILAYILVGVGDTSLPKSIHVLGFTERGRAHLKSLKKSVNLVTRIGSEPWDITTQQADNVYRLGDERIREQNFGQIPVRVSEKCDDLKE